MRKNEITIGMVSLGCSKNLVDSEVMLGLLTERGFRFTEAPDEADVIIVNTCAFIESATQESIDTILEMATYKKEGKCQCLIVTGCLAERYKEEIFREIPEVDGVLGTQSYSSILACVDSVLSGNPYIEMTGKGMGEALYFGRSLTTGNTTAFLKIAEGCDNNCTYCIIPKLRGSYQSRPMEDIIREAEDLAKRGVKELIVIAQDTSYYGTDTHQRYLLPELLDRLSKIDSLHWIRVHYCYPERMTPELIRAFQNPKICPYVDMPIQHASNAVLKRMGRHTTKEEIYSVIESLRREIPDIAIRTSIIVGFPGETEDDFQELCEFIKEIRFDRLGVFPFSCEEEAPASKLPNQISENVKEMRRNELMSIQHEIAIKEAKGHIGETMEVLTEGHDGMMYFGRTSRDSLEIDPMIYFAGNQEIPIGTFVSVKILHTDEYDLIGEVQP